MRSVWEERKKKRWILYIFILIILLTIIGITIWIIVTQKDDNADLIEGTNQYIDEEDQYNEIKEEFDTIFTNSIQKLGEVQLNYPKISDTQDYVVTAFSFEKNEENISVNAKIPYINIANNEAREINAEIKKKYKEKAEELIKSDITQDAIYSVDYVAYIQNNVLSLAIRSQYKQGAKSQKTVIETFNYHLLENRKATISDLLQIKNINQKDATNKIKNEIKKTQEQNKPLIEQGYDIYQRDYNLNMYDITNVEEFLYGKDGMLYIIYSYGKIKDTTEMDLIIFK